jgi:hypothetical protein
MRALIMDILRGKKMVGVGNYPNATIIEQGFYFLAFSSHYNGDFNAFVWLLFNGNYTKISKTSNFFRFFKLKFYCQNKIPCCKVATTSLTIPKPLDLLL